MPPSKRPAGIGTELTRGAVHTPWLFRWRRDYEKGPAKPMKPASQQCSGPKHDRHSPPTRVDEPSKSRLWTRNAASHGCKHAAATTGSARHPGPIF